MTTPPKQIRAVYTDTTIRVYQAYSDAIADAALAAGQFVSPPFKMERMTWIKPSFLWMMYRAGWGGKDDNQKRILAIDISRSGFEWALRHACLSHPPAGMDSATWQQTKAAHPVRIQWDPERSLKLEPLPHRSIQIGLTGEAVPPKPFSGCLNRKQGNPKCSPCPNRLSSPRCCLPRRLSKQNRLSI